MGHEQLPWLTTEWVLSRFSSKLAHARAKYEEFINEGKGEPYREEFWTREGRLLGDDIFVEKVLKRTGHREKESVTIHAIIEEVGKLYGLTENEIISGGKQRYPSEARGMTAYLVRELSGLLLTDLGKK